MKKQNKIVTNTKRLPYSNEELERMFRHLSPEHLPNWSPHKLFIPALALYNGLRMSEACQLQKDNIILANEIPCIQVKRDVETGCTLKNMASARIIPIHPVLLRLGFLKYIHAEGEQLWPELKYSATQGYSQQFMKFFGCFNRKYVTQDTNKAFHSLRINFVECLRQMTVSEEIARRLTGLTGESMTFSRYNSVRPEDILEGLRKVDYALDIFVLKGIQPLSSEEIVEQIKQLPEHSA